MSNRDAICQAIRERRLLQFYYDGGTRVVDPHQLAYNERENVWETGTGLAITHCRNARPDPVNFRPREFSFKVFESLCRCLPVQMMTYPVPA